MARTCKIIPLTNLTQEAALLLAVARTVVAGAPQHLAAPQRPRGDVDWEAFRKLARYHDLTSFAAWGLQPFNLRLPRDLAVELIATRQIQIRHAARLWNEYSKIHRAFHRERIPMVPLKGIALLHDVYRTRPGRLMADIDLLVPPHERVRAETLMRALRYTEEGRGFHGAYWREQGHHLAFQKSSATQQPSTYVELHWLLDYPRPYHPVLPSLWERLRQIQAGPVNLTLLSPEDTLLSLALHNRRAWARPLCLKSVYDLCLVLNKYQQTIDWDYILRESDAARMRTTVYFLLAQAVLLLEQSIPGAVWNGFKVPASKRRWIHQLITRHTFTLPLNATQANAQVFLRTHFLLYDDWWEPTAYVLNVPHEQFARHYHLEPYSRGATRRYRFRYLYMAFKQASLLLSSRTPHEKPKPQHDADHPTTRMPDRYAVQR